MDSCNKTHSSFTLIETLVVTSIIILISTVSLASYNLGTEGKKLEKNTKRAVSTLELARAKAKGADSSLCGGGVGITPAASGYRVIFSQTSLQTSPLCTNGTPTTIIQPFESTIAVLTPTVSVQFNTDSAIVTPKNAVLRNSTLDSCIMVSVSETGVITETKCSSCLPITCP